MLNTQRNLLNKKVKVKNVPNVNPNAHATNHRTKNLTIRENILLNNKKQVQNQWNKPKFLNLKFKKKWNLKLNLKNLNLNNKQKSLNLKLKKNRNQKGKNLNKRNNSQSPLNKLPKNPKRNQTRLKMQMLRHLNNKKTAKAKKHLKNYDSFLCEFIIKIINQMKKLALLLWANIINQELY